MERERGRVWAKVRVRVRITAAMLALDRGRQQHLGGRACHLQRHQVVEVVGPEEHRRVAW